MGSQWESTKSSTSEWQTLGCLAGGFWEVDSSWGEAGGSWGEVGDSRWEVRYSDWKVGDSWQEVGNSGGKVGDSSGENGDSRWKVGDFRQEVGDSGGKVEDSSGEIGELSSLKLNAFVEYLVPDFTAIWSKIHIVLLLLCYQENCDCSFSWDNLWKP